MKLLKLVFILFCLIQLNGCKEEKFYEEPVNTTEVYVLSFGNSKPVYQYVIYNNIEHKKVMGWLNKTQTLSYNEIKDWNDESDRTNPDSPVFKFSYKEIVKKQLVNDNNKSESIETYLIDYDSETKIFKVKLISVDNINVDEPSIEYINCVVSLQTRFI